MCLGEDKCKEGYTGVLCENCDIEKNFTERDNQCEKCPSNASIYISMILVFLFSSLVISQ